MNRVSETQITLSEYKFKLINLAVTVRVIECHCQVIDKLVCNIYSLDKINQFGRNCISFRHLKLVRLQINK